MCVNKDGAIVKKLLGLPVVCMIALGLSGHASAGEDYSCTIERMYRASGESGPVYDAYKKHYVGKTFTVDRASGVMVGALKNAYVTEPQVVDHGSTENSYKVVTTMRVDQGAGAGSSISALNISEFEETAQKPFVFMSGEDAFFGKCVHF